MQSTSGRSMNSQAQTKRVTVDLDGIPVQMEVVATGSGLQEVSGGGRLGFDKALEGMNKVAEKVFESIQQVKPTKATVTYGMELGVEEGSLMAAIVRGSGKASFEITLEWENKPEKED